MFSSINLTICILLSALGLKSKKYNKVSIIHNRNVIAICRIFDFAWPVAIYRLTRPSGPNFRKAIMWISLHHWKMRNKHKIQFFSTSDQKSHESRVASPHRNPWKLFQHKIANVIRTILPIYVPDRTRAPYRVAIKFE